MEHDHVLASEIYSYFQLTAVTLLPSVYGRKHLLMTSSAGNAIQIGVQMTGLKLYSEEMCRKQGHGIV
jgi:hypothetical protein